MKIRFYSAIIKGKTPPIMFTAHVNTYAEKMDIVLKNFPVKREFKENVTQEYALYIVGNDLAEYKFTLGGIVERMW